MTTKYCSRGEHHVDLSGFATSVRQPDGLQVWCRECNQAYQAEYRVVRKERHQAAQARKNAEDLRW